MARPSLTLHFGVALMALAFLLPGHYLPWLSFQSQWLAALGAAIIALGAASCRSRVDWPPLAALAWLSAAVPPLQWALGQVQFVSDAVLPALYLAGFGVCLAAGATLHRVHGARWLDLLFTALGAAAAGSVAVALLQWLGIGAGSVWVADLPRGARPFANLGQPNHLATLLGLGLIAVVRAHERRQLSDWSAACVAAWLGFGVVMVQSRTGWLIVALLFGWWALARRRAGLLRLRPAPMVVAAAVLTLALLSWDALNQSMLMASLSNLDERLQGGPRLGIWRAALDALAQSPWFGYGWNQVTLAQQAVALSQPADARMFQNAHSVVLDIGLWAGLPLMVVWCVAVAAWLRRRVLACDGVDAWSTLAAALALLVHALVEYPLDHAYFLFPLGLFMGSLPAGRVRAAGAASLALPALIGLAMLGWIGADYLKVEQANRDVRLMLAGFGLDKVPNVPPPDVKLLDAPREYHRFMITPARAGMGGEELDWMRRVMQRNAYPPAMMRYALAAGLNGRPDEAAQTLRRICHMHPTPRCDEARVSWHEAQRQFPVLGGIPPP